MADLDGVWFAPYGNAPVALQSAYQPCPPELQVQVAQAFTLSLGTILLPEVHVHHRLPGIFHRSHHVVVFSSLSLGPQPPVQRVHYYGPADSFVRPTNTFLADTIYATNDYDNPQRVNFGLHIVELDTPSDEQAKLLNALGGLAGQVGAIFPAALPYSHLVATLGDSLRKLLDAVEPSQEARFGDMVNLYPTTGFHNQIWLQVGRYVLFDAEVDGTAYTLGPQGHLLKDGNDVLDLPYMVVRIELVNEQSPDVMDAQRAATLLSGLNGGGTDAFKSSLDFVTETVSAYSNFRDLQRYMDLYRRQQHQPGSLTQSEQDLMARLAKDPALAPFLPSPS
jgi:hypothetical protein